MYWKEGCWKKRKKDTVNRRLIRKEELHKFEKVAEDRSVWRPIARDCASFKFIL